MAPQIITKSAAKIMRTRSETVRLERRVTVDTTSHPSVPAASGRGLERGGEAAGTGDANVTYYYVAADVRVTYLSYLFFAFGSDRAKRDKFKIVCVNRGNIWCTA